jgi:hypothetical protein
MTPDFDKAASEISKSKLHFHTIQFLVKDNKKPYGYRPHGSGVLAKIQDRYLIFTASHVTEDITVHPLYINTRVGIQIVVGFCRETDLKMEKFTDVAYILLDKMLGLLLSETYEFLPLDKISHSHRPLLATNYMICSYPEKNIRIDKATQMVYTGTSHFLLSMADEKVFDYYGLDKEKNYAIKFGGKGKDLESGVKTRKIDDPYGISGCGLWFLKPKIVNDKIQIDYYLIGIMIMFKKAKYHILIGNRIELIISALEKDEGFEIQW